MMRFVLQPTLLTLPSSLWEFQNSELFKALGAGLLNLLLAAI